MWPPLLYHRYYVLIFIIIYLPTLNNDDPFSLVHVSDINKDLNYNIFNNEHWQVFLFLYKLLRLEIMNNCLFFIIAWITCSHFHKFWIILVIKVVSWLPTILGDGKALSCHVMRVNTAVKGWGDTVMCLGSTHLSWSGDALVCHVLGMNIPVMVWRCTRLSCSEEDTPDT